MLHVLLANAFEGAYSFHPDINGLLILVTGESDILLFFESMATQCLYSPFIYCQDSLTFSGCANLFHVELFRPLWNYHQTWVQVLSTHWLCCRWHGVRDGSPGTHGYFSHIFNHTGFSAILLSWYLFHAHQLSKKVIQGEYL